MLEISLIKIFGGRFPISSSIETKANYSRKQLPQADKYHFFMSHENDYLTHA